jgi:chorismate mutase
LFSGDTRFPLFQTHNAFRNHRIEPLGDGGLITLLPIWGVYTDQEISDSVLTAEVQMSMRFGLITALLVCDAAVAEENAIKAEKLLSTRTDILGAAIDLNASGNLFTGQMLQMSPGFTTPIHFHPEPMVAYVIEGGLEVTYNGTNKVQYREGDMLIEAVNVLHQGRAMAPAGVKLLILNITTRATPNAIVLETRTSEKSPTVLDLISAALAYRLKLSEDVALSKYISGAQFEDLEREAVVVSGFLQSAEQANLDLRFAEDFIRKQIEASKHVQTTYIRALEAQKDFEGVAARAPDLASLREQFNQLTEVLISLLSTYAALEFDDAEFLVLSDTPDELVGYEAAWQSAIEPLTK